MGIRMVLVGSLHQVDALLTTVTFALGEGQRYARGLEPENKEKPDKPATFGG